MLTHVKINENPLLPLVAFVVVIIGVLVVIIVVAIVAIIVSVIGVSVSSSSFSIPHCHSGTTLPFLLLPLLLPLAVFSGLPGVFALRGSPGLAFILRLTLLVLLCRFPVVLALLGSSGCSHARKKPPTKTSS